MQVQIAVRIGTNPETDSTHQLEHISSKNSAAESERRITMVNPLLAWYGSESKK